MTWVRAMTGASLIAAVACDAPREDTRSLAPAAANEAATPASPTPPSAVPPEPSAPAPETPPARDWPSSELAISLRSTARGEGLFGCGFELVERGFPAVSADGSVVAWIRNDTVTLAVHYEHELRIDGPARAHARISLHTLDSFGGYDSYPSPSAATCKRAREQIAAAVEAANAELERNTWRSLQRLELALVGPEGPATENRELPARERPVELTLVRGSLIAKLPGVAVLHREPGFPVPDDRAILREAWGDPYSGTAMLRYSWLEDCEPSDTCRCNEWTDAFVTRFDAKLYAAVERSPCPTSEASRCTTLAQSFY